MVTTTLKQFDPRAPNKRQDSGSGLDKALLFCSSFQRFFPTALIRRLTRSPSSFILEGN